MNLELLAVALFGGLVLLGVVVLGSRKVPRRLNKSHFQARWLELLSKVKTPEGMVLAIIDADKLLDEALKKRGFRGKTVGERLVAAQRHLSDNDAVWQAHKLRNKLVHEHGIKLRKNDTKRALAGFRQALRDLGAL